MPELSAGARWENVGAGAQLLINNRTWLVKERKPGGVFTLACPSLSKITEGKPDLAKTVEVLYPDHPKYIPSGSERAQSELAIDVDLANDVAVALAVIHLKGRLVAESENGGAEWAVHPFLDDTDLRAHLILMHNVFDGEVVNPSSRHAEDHEATQAGMLELQAPHRHINSYSPRPVPTGSAPEKGNP